MAGAERIELPLKVLETLVVTIGPRAYGKRERDNTMAQVFFIKYFIYALYFLKNIPKNY